MSTANRRAADPSTDSAAPSDAGAPVETGIDLASVHLIGKAFVSRGHFAGRWTAEISVNELARGVYATLGASSKFSVGSLLVKKHSAISSPAPGPIFAMIKRDAGFFPEGGDWEYVVLDAEAHLEDRGKLTLCARCHAEGNADWAFGQPPEAR
jgi:hypothetical protein